MKCVVLTYRCGWAKISTFGEILHIVIFKSKAQAMFLSVLKRIFGEWQQHSEGATWSRAHCWTSLCAFFFWLVNIFDGVIMSKILTKSSESKRADIPYQPLSLEWEHRNRSLYAVEFLRVSLRTSGKMFTFVQPHLEILKYDFILYNTELSSDRGWGTFWGDVNYYVLFHIFRFGEYIFCYINTFRGHHAPTSHLML